MMWGWGDVVFVYVKINGNNVGLISCLPVLIFWAKETGWDDVVSASENVKAKGKDLVVLFMLE